MKIYAVIDTNVVVSALLARNPEAATVKVFEAFFQGRVVPLVNDEIIKEYADVLHRHKFCFPEELVNSVIRSIERSAIRPGRTFCEEEFPDPKDAVFYEVALSKDDAYLITGNTKHFPRTPIVVTPAEMLEILKRS
jgi:putative PIN family toxin of toxin-antitoxin system